LTTDERIAQINEIINYIYEVIANTASDDAELKVKRIQKGDFSATYVTEDDLLKTIKNFKQEIKELQLSTAYAENGCGIHSIRGVC